MTPKNSPAVALAALETAIDAAFTHPAASADLTRAGARIAVTVVRHLAQALAGDPRTALPDAATVTELIGHHVDVTMALKNIYAALATAADDLLSGHAADAVYSSLDQAAGLQQMVAADLNDAHTALT
ncbi:hypothetical protein [Longispora albida]|uniref:hypothetical protein n=1 Tax=Longispora albida TaxID=203523 RepID=UPI000381BCEA|nr:hypothetical protein [Longispora albida]